MGPALSKKVGAAKIILPHYSKTFQNIPKHAGVGDNCHLLNEEVDKDEAGKEEADEEVEEADEEKAGEEKAGEEKAGEKKAGEKKAGEEKAEEEQVKVRVDFNSETVALIPRNRSALDPSRAVNEKAKLMGVARHRALLEYNLSTKHSPYHLNPRAKRLR